jgi:uncharacterized protein with ParB-like and HNH nuclease domain
MSISNSIKVKEVNLFELLSDVDKGLIVIPDFQRDFIWNLKQIEELLNSVINGYFIGSILLLESFLDNLRFAPRLIRGVDRNKIDRRGHKYNKIHTGRPAKDYIVILCIHGTERTSFR